MIYDVPICIDCICLPMCMNKDDNMLIYQCAHVKRELMNISTTLDDYREATLHFWGIDRKFFVKTENEFVLIGVHRRTEDGHHEERWYLFSHGHKIDESWVNAFVKG